MFKKFHKKKVILIDPDKWQDESSILKASKIINENEHIEWVFLGGSLVMNNKFHEVFDIFRRNLNKKIYIFPGSSFQLNFYADGFVIPFPLNTADYNMFFYEMIKSSSILITKPTYVVGYLLLGENWTTTFIVSKAYEISKNFDYIKSLLKLSEIMGFSAIYLEAGSGSLEGLKFETLKVISENTNLPIIAGGGFKDIKSIEMAFKNGADYVVIGNYIEQNVNFIENL